MQGLLTVAHGIAQNTGHPCMWYVRAKCHRTALLLMKEGAVEGMSPYWGGREPKVQQQQ